MKKSPLQKLNLLMAAALFSAAFVAGPASAAAPDAGLDPAVAADIFSREAAIVNAEGQPDQPRLEAEQAAAFAEMQKQDPAGAEALRQKMVKEATDLSMLLRWSTNEEASQDARLTEKEFAPKVEDANSEEPIVQIDVSLAKQTMEMRVNGEVVLAGPVATARPGYVTPRGCFKPWYLNKHQYSYTYHAPMPNSVFFYKSIALHLGDVHVKSHGCVHLQPAPSLQVFDTVSHYGKENTRVCVR